MQCEFSSESIGTSKTTSIAGSRAPGAKTLGVLVRVVHGLYAKKRDGSQEFGKEEWNGLVGHQVLLGRGVVCPLFNIKDLNHLKDSFVRQASSQTTSDHLVEAPLQTQVALPKATSPDAISSHLEESQHRVRTTERVAAPPGLLRCIIISWSAKRADFFRAAAESESWETVVCGDIGQFMRNTFRLKFPLTIVDLPEANASDYGDLRNATERSRAVSDSLLVVSVVDEAQDVEIWARQLGAWAHLPGALNPAGLEMIFREARQALARQETASVEREKFGANDS